MRRCAWGLGRPDGAAALLAGGARDPGRAIRTLTTCASTSPPSKRHWAVPRGDGCWPADPLSEAEFAVLRLLPTGLTQREIGGNLYLSLNTVRTHIQASFRKLGVSRREDAVARAREAGLLWEFPRQPDLHG